MKIFQLALLCLLTAFLSAQPSLSFIDVATGFTQPTDIVSAEDGSNRLFITEKTGRIRVIDLTTNNVLAGNYMNLSSTILTNSERGLLGLAFHPDFATNGFLYVNYVSNGTGTPSPGQTVISRFQATSASATSVDIDTETVLLTITQPFANHNAGDIAFGPDGYLYIPTGDGGSGGDPDDNGQDPQSLLAKMLRIDVDNTDPGLEYAIPDDNPFAGSSVVRNEIFSLGLRNPWRIAFDRQTGDLWIGDVGQGQREEVDFIAAGNAGGQNFGWDCREGAIAYSGSSSILCGNGSVYTEPIFDYDHGNTGGQSLTGGFVYRGTQGDDLLGWYICADFSSNRFFLLPPGASGSASLVRQTGTGISGPSTFGEDEEGNLYVAELFSGTISRIVSLLSLPAEVTNWTATPSDKDVLLRWTTQSEDNTASFRLERSQDGEVFSSIKTMAAAGNSTSALDYDYLDETPPLGQVFYRLVRVDLDGTEHLLPIRRVFFRNQAIGEPTVSPNPTNGDLVISIPELQVNGPVSLRLISSDGRVVYTRHRLLEAGPHNLSHILPELPTGIYQAVIGYDGKTFTRAVSVKQR